MNLVKPLFIDLSPLNVSRYLGVFENHNSWELAMWMPRWCGEIEFGLWGYARMDVAGVV